MECLILEERFFLQRCIKCNLLTVQESNELIQIKNMKLLQVYLCETQLQKIRFHHSLQVKPMSFIVEVLGTNTKMRNFMNIMFILLNHYLKLDLITV